MNKKITLSCKQKEVIRLMREGKELYYYQSFDSSAGFNGGGGQLSVATFHKLKELGIIQLKHLSKTSTMEYYHLTNLGKTIEI